MPLALQCSRDNLMQSKEGSPTVCTTSKRKKSGVPLPDIAASPAVPTLATVAAQPPLPAPVLVSSSRHPVRLAMRQPPSCLSGGPVVWVRRAAVRNSSQSGQR
jgi:hypothetical protein